MPLGHWKTTTLLAILSLNGIVAPFVLDNAVDRPCFEIYFEYVLVPAQPRLLIDSTLVKALARVHRWNKLLETRCYGSAAELAVAEKINPSYVSRMLWLILLAPAIVEEIVEGRRAIGIEATVMLRPFSADCTEQRRALPQCAISCSLPPDCGHSAGRCPFGGRRAVSDLGKVGFLSRRNSSSRTRIPQGG